MDVIDHENISSSVHFVQSFLRRIGSWIIPHLRIHGSFALKQGIFQGVDGKRAGVRRLVSRPAKGLVDFAQYLLGKRGGLPREVIVTKGLSKVIPLEKMTMEMN